jgi:hypothetical protein
MRRAVCLLLAVVALCGTAGVLQAQGRPQFRPALLGTKPTSLINRISAAELAKRGQKDGAVMFCAIVGVNGEAVTSWTYRAMPGTQALTEEVERALVGTSFVPAIYNHQPVQVLLYGTAVYAAGGLKPSIRIFLNQDPQELKKMSDFIGPQPVFGADSKFKGLTPPESGTPVPLTAVVDLNLKVDANGQLKNVRVLAEEPPMLGFADAAIGDFRDAKFIPAFRDGDRAESDTVLPVCYKPAD